MLYVNYISVKLKKGFPGSSAGKESTCNAGDPSSIPQLGRSPGEGNEAKAETPVLWPPHAKS